MKVLMLCDVLFPQTVGGAGRFARELAQALVAGGDEVQFLTRQTSHSPRKDPIPTHYYPPPGLHSPGHFRRLFRHVDKLFAADIIHFHQPLPAFLSLPSHLGRPLVYSFHSSWPAEFLLKASPLPLPVRRLAEPVLAAIERKMARKATKITTESLFVQNEVRRLYGRESMVIPGGVRSDLLQPPEAAATSPSRPKEGFEIITLRNLVPRMGLTNLVRAMSLLPDHVRLKIGGQGPLRGQLSDLIRTLHLEHRVQLCGHVPDAALPSFYGQADLFVLPTAAWEGFGLVILEALSCGTPVLGTAIGAIPEVLSQFDPSWIIPEPTPEAMASTMTAFMTKDPPDRRALHEHVHAHYRWEIIAQRYHRLFESLQAKR